MGSTNSHEMTAVVTSTVPNRLSQWLEISKREGRSRSDIISLPPVSVQSRTPARTHRLKSRPSPSKAPPSSVSYLPKCLTPPEAAAHPHSTTTSEATGGTVEVVNTLLARSAGALLLLQFQAWLLGA